MQPYFEDSTVRLYHGDCLDVMAAMPAGSVDALITSPPYAQQRKATYGGTPEADYPAWTVAWMREARRLLKSDGSVVINIRPHVRNGQISDYTLRTRLALREDGWNECEELIWDKKGGAPLGSNYRPRRSWESLHWFALHGKPYSDPKAGGGDAKKPTATAGGSARRYTRQEWTNTNRLAGIRIDGRVRVRDVIAVTTDATHGSEATDHPAPYPPALAEWVAKLVCPPGGTILDPFSGSASTGVAALRNGMSYIGIDTVAEYVEMSRRRLTA